MGKIADRFNDKRKYEKLVNSQDQKVKGMNDYEVQEALKNPAHADKDLTKKGHFRGFCNRRDCLSGNDVEFWNWGSYAFYCASCAAMLNRDNRAWTEGKDLCNRMSPDQAESCYVL